MVWIALPGGAYDGNRASRPRPRRPGRSGQVAFSRLWSAVTDGEAGALPGVDAAGDIDRIRPAASDEKGSRRCRSSTHVAHDEQRTILRQLDVALSERRHRQERSALQPDRGEFV